MSLWRLSATLTFGPGLFKAGSGLSQCSVREQLQSPAARVCMLDRVALCVSVCRLQGAALSLLWVFPDCGATDETSMSHTVYLRMCLYVCASKAWDQILQQACLLWDTFLDDVFQAACRGTPYHEGFHRTVNVQGNSSWSYFKYPD